MQGVIGRNTILSHRSLYELKPLGVDRGNDYIATFRNEKGFKKQNGVHTRLKIDNRWTGSVLLEYRFKFSSAFRWGEKGGTLPGLLGGKWWCTPGNNNPKCWKVQLAWEADGSAALKFRLPNEERQIRMDTFQWKKENTILLP